MNMKNVHKQGSDEKNAERLPSYEKMAEKKDKKTTLHVQKNTANVG